MADRHNKGDQQRLSPSASGTPPSLVWVTIGKTEHLASLIKKESSDGRIQVRWSSNGAVEWLEPEDYVAIRSDDLMPRKRRQRSGRHVDNPSTAAVLEGQEMPRKRRSNNGRQNHVVVTDHKHTEFSEEETEKDEASSEASVYSGATDDEEYKDATVTPEELVSSNHLTKAPCKKEEEDDDVTIAPDESASSNNLANVSCKEEDDVTIAPDESVSSNNLTNVSCKEEDVVTIAPDESASSNNVSNAGSSNQDVIPDGPVSSLSSAEAIHSQVMSTCNEDIKVKLEGSASTLSAAERQKRRECFEYWKTMNTDPRTKQGRYVFRRACQKRTITYVLGGAGMDPWPIVKKPPKINGAVNPFIRPNEVYVAGNECWNPYGPRFPGDKGLVTLIMPSRPKKNSTFL
uniref:Uncharacterized protein n=1 Tax=Amphora coffeiformis TaxID=265554 RepID=A0A7S3LFL4_9STRA